MWDKSINLVIDVDRRFEPLVAVDAGGLWHDTRMDPLVQSPTVLLRIYLASISASGALTYRETGGNATMAVCGRLRVGQESFAQGGDVLFGIESMDKTAAVAPDSEYWTGDLVLNTDPLIDAFAEHFKLDVRMEVVLEDGDYSARFQWDVPVLRSVCPDGLEPVPVGPTYYTQAQVDALLEAITDQFRIDSGKRLVVDSDGNIGQEDR
jgi:hypothetical protein